MAGSPTEDLIQCNTTTFFGDVSSFATYMAWLETTRTAQQEPVVRTFTGQAIWLVKTPQDPCQPLATIELTHNPNTFIHTLKEFLNHINTSTKMALNQLRSATLLVSLPQLQI